MEIKDMPRFLRKFLPTRAGIKRFWGWVEYLATFIGGGIAAGVLSFVAYLIFGLMLILLGAPIVPVIIVCVLIELSVMYYQLQLTEMLEWYRNGRSFSSCAFEFLTSHSEEE